MELWKLRLSSFVSSWILLVLIPNENCSVFMADFWLLKYHLYPFFKFTRGEKYWILKWNWISATCSTHQKVFVDKKGKNESLYDELEWCLVNLYQILISLPGWLYQCPSIIYTLGNFIFLTRTTFLTRGNWTLDLFATRRHGIIFIILKANFFLLLYLSRER